MDAAEAWANAKCGRADRKKPATVDDQTRQDFAALGVVIEAAEAEDEDEDEDKDALPIAAENWPSLLAFMACETQWRVVGSMAGLIWIGLDYVAVKLLLDLDGHDRRIFDDVRIMEAAALPILNEAD